MEGYADFPYRLTLDEVLELKRNTLTALTTIHQWIDSFVPINRLPTDVLSLIPTHLHTQGDRFRVTFVCRHWRRTFLQYAALWSHLYLSKGEVYVKTLLERAKGSPLSILASSIDPVSITKLLPSYTKQITDLEFTNNRWAGIQWFSKINSGPFPLLHTLNINAVQGVGPGGLLFSGAVGLKDFRLYSKWSPFLSRFIFPNLTSFELLVVSEEEFPDSELLDFLEASPMLRAVRMKIIVPMTLEGVPQERVVVLHNVESLCLTARDGGHGYKLATHISCPSAKHTSLTHTLKRERYFNPRLAKFPTSASLNTIIQQYTRNLPIEDVTFEVKTDSDYFIACSLTLRSADTTVIRLGFEVARDGEDSSNHLKWERSFAKMCSVTSEASWTIQDPRLLKSVKRLHMYGYPPLDPDLRRIKRVANELGRLLQSLGPLEELAICRCDIRPYFYPFSHPKYYGFEGQFTYPPIKVMSISHPMCAAHGNLAVGLVNLAMAKHELGEPFERVTVRMYEPPADMDEKLRPWVGVVDCRAPDESHESPNYI